MTSIEFFVAGRPAPQGSDHEWALDLYSSLARGGDDEKMLYLEIEGDPWSKSRPRFARGRAYQPRDDLEAEQHLAAHMKRGGAWKFSGNVVLVCRFYRSNFQRIDADNLIKHVCDSANGVLWADDSQVTLVMGEVLLDAERPRTIIMAGNHSSTLLRGVDAEKECAGCGAKFTPAGGKRRDTKRFCSSECRYGNRLTKLEPIACRQCGQTFKPTTKKQILCSRACHGAEMSGGNRVKVGGPMSRCPECDKELAHRRGGRCRDCWKANPRFYADPKDAA